MSISGESDEARALKRAQEQKQNQREYQEHQQRIQQAFNQQGQLSEGWMREILDVDLDEHLKEYEVDKISGLINKQWLLSNLTAAQTHDRQYKLEVMKLKVLGSFPPAESAIQGEARAFILDDETENLNALTAEKRIVIDQIFESLKTMVTRSRDGFERTQMNTSIARSEKEEQKDEESGGRLRGIFS